MDLAFLAGGSLSGNGIQGNVLAVVERENTAGEIDLGSLAGVHVSAGVPYWV